MFPVILALCFVLKIFRCSEHYAPKKQVKSIKVVNCNIKAAIKLQCTYNDAIRTLFAQCTQPKYRDLSTNNMRRY